MLKAEILEKIIKQGRKLDTTSFAVSNKVIPIRDALRHSRYDKKVERTGSWPLMFAGRMYTATALRGPEVTTLSDYDDADHEGGMLLTVPQAKIMYEHDANPYKPPTLEAWAKTIPIADADNMFAALYIASLRGANYFPVVCPQPKCQFAKLTDDVDINTMIRFKSDKVKERFEKIYRENNGKRKAEKIEILTEELKQDFKTEEQTREFIERNIERLQRNKIVRKTRLARKINLNKWNWFCTFTYSNEKHTEDSFRKGLSDVLKRMVHRKGWRYIGVWERGGETNRLHFHGIFYIPENGMPGELEEKKDYSFGSRKRQIIIQNTYFNDKFGRNDFNELNVRREITDSARYLMKYIEKSGEKLIY